ncbi:MAG: hypothetical protein QW304_03095 [Thermoproteota archaeon]
MKIVRRGDYIRIFFRDFKPGEVFDLVTRINGKLVENKIVDIGDAFTLPDTVAGWVEYGSSRRGTNYLPLIGETVVEEIGGRRVGHYSHLEPLPDGRVAGTVQIWEAPAFWIFFKGDEVIENIEGKKIIDTSEDGFAVLPDGTLVGNIEIEEEGKVGVWKAFKDESFIKSIGGKEVESAEILQVWCDGTLVGVAYLKDGREAIFKGDTLIEEIQGKKIIYVEFPLFLPDGILAGLVTLEGGGRMLFKNDVLIDSIQGRKITKPNLVDYKLLSDGTIVGTAWVQGYERELLFKDDTLIDRIGGKEFKTARISHSASIFAGEACLENGRWIPFIGDKLIDEVNGLKVLEGRFLFKLPNGEPVCLVKLEDGRELLLKGDDLIEKIGGKKVINVGRPIKSLPDGTLVGSVKLEDGRKLPFRGDTLLEEIKGRKVVGGGLSALTPLRMLDGTIIGGIVFEDGKSSTFFWYKDEVHIPFPL